MSSNNSDSNGVPPVSPANAIPETAEIPGDAINNSGSNGVPPASPANAIPATAEIPGDAIDFTDDTPDSSPATFEPRPYDPRPKEDAARRWIAYSLIGLLFLIIIGIFYLLFCKRVTVSEIKEFSVILGPVVTLVSAATGFYYGTKSSN